MLLPPAAFALRLAVISRFFLRNFAAKCARAHFASKWSRPSHRPSPRAVHPAAPCLYHLRAGRRGARARRWRQAVCAGTKTSSHTHTCVRVQP